MNASLALSTAGLTRQYGPEAGVFGVDLAVPRGSVYGLVGPNGAGKTTLLDLITGLRHADAGTVDLQISPSRVSLVPDVPEFERWLTAAEVLGLSGSLVGRAPTRSRVTEELHRVGLSDSADRRVGGFSRGMSQRLALAAASISDPELVLLDEPSSALDPGGRAAVLDLIAEWSVRATVVLSSHILSDVQRVADTVGVLRAGHLISQGPLQQLLDTHVRPSWLMRVRQPSVELVTRLRQQPWAEEVADLGGGALSIRARSLAEGEQGIVAVAAAASASVVSLTPAEADLESVFLTMTAPEAT